MLAHQHLNIVFIILIIIFLQETFLLMLSARIPSTAFSTGNLISTVAKTHSFKRLQCLLIHRTYLFLLHILLVALYGLRHPERGVQKEQDRDYNEKWMLNDSLPMLLAHDKEHGKEGHDPV